MTTEYPPTYPPTPGMLFADGLARRMGGGDKPMRLLHWRAKEAL